MLRSIVFFIAVGEKITIPLETNNHDLKRGPSALADDAHSEDDGAKPTPDRRDSLKEHRESPPCLTRWLVSDGLPGLFDAHNRLSQQTRG